MIPDARGDSGRLVLVRPLQRGSAARAIKSARPGGGRRQVPSLAPVAAACGARRARGGEAEVALASRASFARAACAETAPPVARRGRRASGEDGQHDSWQLSMSEIRPCAPQLPAPAWYARATAYGGPETCTRHRAVRCLLSSSGFFALVRGKGVIHPQIAGENVWLRTRERSTHIPFRGVRFHIRVLSPPLYATLPAASHEPPIHP